MGKLMFLSLYISSLLLPLQLGSLPVPAGGVLLDQCAEVGAQVREAIKLRRGFLVTADKGELVLLAGLPQHLANLCLGIIKVHSNASVCTSWLR
jgi:hypothetical protein